MTVYNLLDLAGTFVFAISGVRIAAEKKMDIFGAVVIGIATAIGGGTIRDLLLGSTPVAWMQDTLYLYIIIIAVILGLLFDRFIFELKNTLLIFDSIGLGVFTLAGMQKAFEFGLSHEYAIIIGITTATAGGIIRDVLANEVPVILRKEIYATACLAGALAYMFFQYVGLAEPLNTIFTILLIVIIRTVAVKFNISFPKIKA
ncbi:MAG: trimeric intracellular cation channel family protein [Bacteroidetes bacterium]|nr:MAG: trimeric intracellular cation channel family protein [Bacteroidota bacterium]RLD86270.1 MAG: trimeric intracellular cation channel family protein [Bacteroidota bacterium]